ncbi:hypothetical protein JHK82_023049 [Glycine max]|nr:hypothetical protein JHK82_023049 [Glycine max]
MRPSLSSRTKERSCQCSNATLDMDQTVSQRFEPSPHTTLMGKQSNPWNILGSQLVKNQHRGVSRERSDFSTPTFVSGKIFSSYMKHAEVLIRKLLKVLLKKLNVKELDKPREKTLMGAMILGFNYYPACPDPEVVAGVGPHSDVSSITVLLQDDIGGLYVRGIDDDSWIFVPPVQGALISILGMCYR